MKSSRSKAFEVLRFGSLGVVVPGFGVASLLLATSGQVWAGTGAGALCAVGIKVLVDEVKKLRTLRRLGAALRAEQRGDRLVVEVELVPAAIVDLERATLALSCRWIYVEDLGPGVIQELERTEAAVSGPRRLGHGEAVKQQLELIIPAPQPPQGETLTWTLVLEVKLKGGDVLVEEMSVDVAATELAIARARRSSPPPRPAPQ